jgi:glyoxylase-like metal-dependent hydrolase (beta-lactamase superfamily II)
MLFRNLVVGLLETNCYLISCDRTSEGAIIDPGGDAHKILSAVRDQGLAVRYVLNTHCHFDHMAANDAVVEATGAALALHHDELPTLAAGGGTAWFGLPAEQSRQPDVELTDGQVLEVGALRIRVLHTPGHSPGSVTFYLEEEGVAFDGDVLFSLGVGRADLPGGDWDTLLNSIRQVLFSLPDDTILYPGHGPRTTVGQEKRFNPWMR